MKRGRCGHTGQLHTFDPIEFETAKNSPIV